MVDLKRKDLIYPELSYKVIGMLFTVWRDLGFGYKEHIYQKSVARELKNANINFIEQAPAEVIYKNEKVGMCYLDFLIDNKIVLELKVRNYFSQKDIKQLYSYLKAKNLQLGLIVHFTQGGVKFKRVVNIG